MSTVAQILGQWLGFPRWTGTHCVLQELTAGKWQTKWATESWLPGTDALGVSKGALRSGQAVAVKWNFRNTFPSSIAFQSPIGWWTNPVPVLRGPTCEQGKEATLQGSPELQNLHRALTCRHRKILQKIPGTMLFDFIPGVSMQVALLSN